MPSVQNPAVLRTASSLLTRTIFLDLSLLNRTMKTEGNVLITYWPCKIFACGRWAAGRVGRRRGRPARQARPESPESRLAERVAVVAALDPLVDHHQQVRLEGEAEGVERQVVEVGAERPVNVV